MMSNKISKSARIAAMAITIAGVITWLAGCGGQGGTTSSQPAASGTVAKYGPVPKDSYKPKVGRYGGQMVMASFGEGLKSFNVITANETSSTDYTQLIFEPLIDSDPWTDKPRPGIAESWEHSSDYLVWTFHLRKDIKFNNGAPLTAADVLFTYRLIYDPKITCASRDIMKVDGKEWKVEEVDPYTVRFTLPTPYAIFLKVVGSAGASIISKAACEPAYKAGTFNSFMGADATPEQVVGTGPFMLDRYIPGQRLILKKNPHYWRKDAAGQREPYLDRMMFLWVQNYDAWMLKFKSGEVDGYFMRGADYPILKPLEKQDNFKVWEFGPSMAQTFLTFNQNPGVNKETGKPYLEPYKVKWFRNTTFRQAIAYCIDREGLVKTVYNGLGSPNYAPCTSSVGYFYNPNTATYEYNLDKARALLRQIGLYDRDGDGTMEDEDGHPVQFTLMTNSGNNLREQTAEIVRKDMAKLGIQVDLKYIEFNTLITKLDETYDWEAVIMALTGATEPQFGANVWLSSGRTHEWYPRQPKPSTPWEARIDEIYTLGIKEMDPAKRKKLYDEWQVIAGEQQPFIYTVARAELYAFRDRFENVYPTVLSAANQAWCTWNIHEVFVKEGQPLN